MAAVFLTNGALYANVVPRYPEIKDELGLGNATLGSAIAAFPLGALLAGLLAAAAIARFGSARVATQGIVLLAVALLLVALVPNGIGLALVLFLAGGLDAIVDVAQNAHGLRVQRRYGRSILNAFHGLWSIGAVLGGLMGAAAAGLGVPLVAHLALSSALFSVVALTARRFMLRGPENTERGPDATDGGGVEGERGEPTARRGPRWRDRRGTVVMLAGLGVLAACGAVVEDAAASWGALYLRDRLAAGVMIAGLAFVVFQVAMTTGRLLGDRVVDRFGQRAVVGTGGIVTAAGMGGALAFPSIGTTLVGYALAGLGVATLVPAAMHAADELPGLADGLGLTIVSWLLRVGFLLSAPLVGLVADHSSLRVGLLSVVLAGTVTFLLSPLLSRRPRATSPD